MYTRILDFKEAQNESFFLWGPRQSGKSTLLKSLYPDAMWIQLLNSREFFKYQSDPHLIYQEIAALSQPPRRIIVDEIQKVPKLLDEIHLCIEDLGVTFGLCGSSARKVKRGHANLLGGRALRFELCGLVSAEVETNFSLERFLNHGVLPKHFLMDRPQIALKSYAADYLKEEIAAEGLVRNLPAFSEFLRVSAMSDTEILNYENIARECSVAATTVKGFYSILEDTLIGSLVPSFSLRPKRRVIQAPKFYYGNVGIVNILAKRGKIEAKTEVFGKAFENWIYHEINSHRLYSMAEDRISYWRLASGVEVDFVIGDAKIAVEVKGTDRVRESHLAGLESFKVEYPEVKERLVVSLADKDRKLANGIWILNYRSFLKKLWANEWY